MPGYGQRRAVGPAIENAPAPSTSRGGGGFLGGVGSFFGGIGDDISSGVGSARDWVSDQANDLSSFHFEGRDARNQTTPSQGELDTSPDWRRLSDAASVYHQNGGADDAKYVREDARSSDPSLLERVADWFGPGGSEAVIDGDTGLPMADAAQQATYNYVNPAGPDDGLVDTVKHTAGHFLFDVVPYWFGGNVRGDEGTNFAERVIGPANYEAASNAIGGAVDWVGETASGIGNGISNGIDTATSWAGDRVDDVSNLASAGVGWAGDRVNDVAAAGGRALDWAGDTASNVGSTVSNGLGAAASWAGSLFGD